MMGRGIQAERIKTAWEADKLVITTIHAFTDPDSGKPSALEVKQIAVARIAGVARRRDDDEAASSAAAASTTRTVYRKL